MRSLCLLRSAQSPSSKSTFLRSSCPCFLARVAEVSSDVLIGYTSGAPRQLVLRLVTRKGCRAQTPCPCAGANALLSHVVAAPAIRAGRHMDLAWASDRQGLSRPNSWSSVIVARAQLLAKLHDALSMLAAQKPRPRPFPTNVCERAWSLKLNTRSSTFITFHPVRVTGPPTPRQRIAKRTLIGLPAVAHSPLHSQLQ